MQKIKRTQQASIRRADLINNHPWHQKKEKVEYVQTSSSKKGTPYMQYTHIPVLDAKSYAFPLLLHLIVQPFLFLPQRKRLVVPDEDVAAC
jgi:hypothetical protein